MENKGFDTIWPIFFLVIKCLLQQRLMCARGSKRPHAPQQTSTQQAIVKTNVPIQTYTHDNTEEENVQCSCVGWILNKHILGFPATNQYVVVLMSSSLEELIQAH